eukprot:6326410-Lingulodinium_polyedra.AAC.1
MFVYQEPARPVVCGAAGHACLHSANPRAPSPGGGQPGWGLAPMWELDLSRGPAAGSGPAPTWELDL